MNNHNSFNHHAKTKSEVSTISISDDDAAINKKLPKELLLRIFSFLDVVSLCRCAQVSKFWNILALDGSNWQRVDLFEFQRDIVGPVVENISKRCGGFLKSLSLRGCQSITDAALRTFAQQCRNIEELNLNNCKEITDTTCESLGKYSHKLSWLDISSCPQVSVNSLKGLSDGCRSLKTINISWCMKITSDGLEALAKGCTELHTFIGRGLGQVTDVGIGHIAKHCKNLRKIDLHSCNNITDEAVSEIGNHCHELLFVCISNCARLTDASLVSLGHGCHELRTLEVACCSHFTDNGFQALAKNCNKLEKMDLEECIQITDATLNYLASYCPNVSALTLSHCELLTDEGIRHIGSSACATEHLHILELDNCPLITDASLEHLMGCQGLERIELYDCQLITRAGIRRLRVVAALSQVSTLVGSARASSVTTPRRNIHNLQKSKQHSEIRNEFQELFDLLDVKQLPENLSATELSPLNAHTTQRKRFKDYKEKNSSSSTFFENKNGFSENLLNHQGHVMVSGILSNGHFQNFLRQTISSLARQPSRGFKTKRGLQYTGIHKKEPEEETTSRGAFYQNILKKREILSGDKTDIDDIMKNVKTKKSKNDNLLGEIAGNPELQKFLNAAVLQGYKTGRSDKLGTSEKNSNQEYYSKFMRRVLLVSLIVGLYCFTVYVTGLPGILRMKKNFEIMPENVNVTFDDVKGVDEVKDELANIVGYLRDPEKFTCLGARLPKGVLMVGPPGVGKTLLARAIAGEANVPFFYAAGSEFDEVFVGQGAKRVRQLFSAAKMRSPCIIFIDEIDSVGASRTSSEIHPYANQTINQLLGEMDGFNQNEGVIVVGATNRKDVLDKAILRPGRFDVEVTITLPDMKGRIDILKHYLTRVKCSKDVDIEKLGKGTFGMSGAELENIVNQAALKAATDNQLLVHMEHFEYARDKILMGPEKKSRTPDEETNWVTACHEAGHTIVAFFTKDASPIHKVTIIRRGQALGHTSFLPQKDQFNFTKSQLYARMDVAMGGRVAEELVFGLDKVTTGASGDFTDATAVAHQIVESFGMSEKIGVGRYTGRTVSPETQKLIDDEVHKILQESYERAKVILKAHINEHKNLSQALMKYETLDKSEVESLIAGKKLKK